MAETLSKIAEFFNSVWETVSPILDGLWTFVTKANGAVAEALMYLDFLPTEVLTVLAVLIGLCAVLRIVGR